MIVGRLVRLRGHRPKRIAAAAISAGALLGMSVVALASAEGRPPDFTTLPMLSKAPPTSVNAPQSRAAVDQMLAVPAGSYPIGRDAGPADQRPAHRVALDAFRIDRTEVTNAAFAEFLNALSV